MPRRLTGWSSPATPPARTNVQVINVGGTGAQTVEGIKIVDVGGTSGGSFRCSATMSSQGEQAVVGGAYAYRLQKNGISTPADGDWYLRSAFIDPACPTSRSEAALCARRAAL